LHYGSLRLLLRNDGTISLSNDTPTPGLCTLSLHDALPICCCCSGSDALSNGRRSCVTSGTPSGSGTPRPSTCTCRRCVASSAGRDRKSTRLNSSHVKISYAVFCLKKKNNKKNETGSNLQQT